MTVVGKDRPGVTSALFTALSAHGVEVLDIEQVVIRRRLVLGVLVTMPRDETSLRRSVEKVASDLGMDVDLDRGTGDNRARPEGRSHVTVLGSPLRPSAVSAIAGRIADTGANIDRIVRMARYPVTAIEMDVSGASPDLLRTLLSTEASHQRVDIAVQPAGMLRHGRKLIVMDVDSTLVQGEVIEMLASHAGSAATVAEITERAMSGELEFADSLRERVRTLEGLEQTVEVLAGSVPDSVVVSEGQIEYEVDLRKGQKTGLFLDQRENREAAARYARGRLLDCFSYHGGFALSLAGRCTSVEAVDISSDAVARITLPYRSPFESVSRL